MKRVTDTPCTPPTLPDVSRVQSSQRSCIWTGKLCLVAAHTAWEKWVPRRPGRIAIYNVHITSKRYDKIWLRPIIQLKANAPSWKFLVYQGKIGIIKELNHISRISCFWFSSRMSRNWHRGWDFTLIPPKELATLLKVFVRFKRQTWKRNKVKGKKLEKKIRKTGEKDGIGKLAPRAKRGS